MRWNCPHCATALSVPDEKLGATWSFSRCYLCAGYSLVRKSDLNLIKIDRAPNSKHLGDGLIFPDRVPDTTKPIEIPKIPMLGTPPETSAIQQVAEQVIQKVTQKMAPSLPPASPSSKTVSTPPAAKPQDNLNLSPALPQNTGWSFPNLLPEEPKVESRSPYLAPAIAILAFLAVGFGFYSYQQGEQSFKEIARNQAPKAPTEWMDQVHRKSMAPQR